jgi:hypothetical protein
LLTWFFNAFIIIILPYDIYLSNLKEQDQGNGQGNDQGKNQGKNQGIDQGQEVIIDNLLNIIRILYSIIYWSISLLSWILNPFIIKYESSGYFTRRERIFYSIKSNLLFYGILLLVGAILLAWAYYKLSNEVKEFFKSNIFNLSYIYGFFFLVLLLGYSIPKLPKNIYDKIFYKRTAKNLETKAKDLKSQLDKINNNLLDSYNKLVNISEGIQINKELNANSKLEKLEDKIKDKETEETRQEMYEKFLDKKIKYIKNNEKLFGIKIKNINFEENEKIDMKNFPDKIASLNITLKENEWDNLRLQCQIQSTYNDWCYIKTIIKKGKKYKSSLINQDLRDSKLLNSENDEFIPLENISSLKIIYYMKIHPLILFIFSVIFTILGLIILLSEICISLPIKISIFSILQYWTQNVFVIHIFIICSVFVFLFMSLYALLNFRLTKNYRLYGPRQTDAVSMLYFTNNFSRIIFPLSLNILFMINHGNDATKQTVLETHFGININNEIFLYISEYSPLVLIVFVLLNICGIFSKLMNCLSFETLGSFFFSQSQTEDKNYLLEINKKNKGKLLTESIMDKIIEE